MRYTTNHIKQLKEGAISRVADTAYALRFLKLLVTPWEKMKAFELGVIDKDGRRTTFKTPAGREYKTELKTMEQKSSYTIFHRLVFNIKRLLNKVPFGKTRLASYAAALFLIKEHTGMSEKKIKQIMDKVELESTLTVSLNQIRAKIPKFVKNFAKFHAVLTSEQRSEIVENMEKRLENSKKRGWGKKWWKH